MLLKVGVNIYLCGTITSTAVDISFTTLFCMLHVRTSSIMTKKIRNGKFIVIFYILHQKFYLVGEVYPTQICKAFYCPSISIMAEKKSK